jgi:hypothetical protein
MRFDDGQALPVTVHNLENDGRRFALAEYRGPGDRPIDFQIDL